MRTYLKRLGPTHYRSAKDIFAIFYKEGMRDYDLSYYWRCRCVSESIGVFTREGDLLGFALVMKKASTPGNLYLPFIAVHPDFKGLDLGSAMLKHILSRRLDARGAIHLVPLSSIRLRAWYERHGFRFTTELYMNFHSYGTRSRTLSM